MDELDAREFYWARFKSSGQVEIIEVIRKPDAPPFVFTIGGSYISSLDKWEIIEVIHKPEVKDAH